MNKKMKQSPPHSRQKSPLERVLGWIVSLGQRWNFLLFLFRNKGANAQILPAQSISGRSLVLVVAIMTFLAGLTAGAVHLVLSAASDWSKDLSREMTIQIRSMPGRSVEADIKLVVDLSKKIRGIDTVYVLTRQESEKLLEPWLGAGLDLKEMLVPRLIALRLSASFTPDITTFRSQLTTQVPSAILDDHRLWLQQLRLMADMFVVIGVGILILVFVATGFAVVFATRGAMAGTAHIIGVLHLVGAEDRYIAAQFQHHFFWLGLRGGLWGSTLAIVFYMIMAFFSSNLARGAGGEQIEILMGRLNLSFSGYSLVFILGAVIAFVAAAVSRETVFRALSRSEE